MNHDRLFAILINDKPLISFETIFENNDSKLKIELGDKDDEPTLYNWFDLHFILMNYTHADNWRAVDFFISEREVKSHE